MVDEDSSIFGTLTKGYTLVELVIVLAIITFMGLLTIYGFSNQNKDQRIISSQREIVVNLRSLQTKVDSGVQGRNVVTARFDNGNNFYCLNDLTAGCATGTKVSLTAGVTLSITPTPVIIYFSHPAYAGHLANQCGANVLGAMFFACVGPSFIKCDGTVTCSGTGTSAKIGFTGSANRFITIEGSGMNVNRIYESTN